MWVDFPDNQTRYRHAVAKMSDELIYCEGYILRKDKSFIDAAWLYDWRNDRTIDAAYAGNVACYFGMQLTAKFVGQYNSGKGAFNSDEFLSVLEHGLPPDAIWRQPK